MGFLDDIIKQLEEYAKGFEPTTVIEEPKAEPFKDTFDDAINFVLKEEGGYSNNRNDPGGETKFGISKKSYPHLDIANLTLEQAKNIYYNEYWLKTGAKVQEIDPYLALVLFDTGVNMGVPTAIRMMQRVLNVKEDGIIGPVTIEALQDHGKNAAERFLSYRLLRYAEFPTWRVFKGGWTSRVIRLAMEANRWQQFLNQLA